MRGSPVKTAVIFSGRRPALARTPARMTGIDALAGMTIAVFALGCGTASAQMDDSTMPAASALGATTPLGTAASTTPAGPTGIPFGSTELNAGGTSPAPITPLSGTTSCYGSGTMYGSVSGGLSGTGIAGPPSGYGISTGLGGMSTSTSGTGGTGSGLVGVGTPTSNSTFDGGGTAGLSAGTPISPGSPPLNSGCVAVPPGTAAASPGSASPQSTPGNMGEASLNGGTIPLGATELNSAGVSPIVPVPTPTMVAPVVPSGQ
jgi:hypothetical protein